MLQPGDNTRKTFEPESLTRLKGSIRTYGVRRNLEVILRPAGKYEIVTGERRWRATMELLAELDGEEKTQREMLPCLVLDAQDVSRAPVLNILENLLRDDVPPGEEAEGYYQLTQRQNPDTGKEWTVSEIAEAVNQEPKYIRRRMQLRRSPAVLLDAVNARKIPVTIAELVGRIPSREMREVAAKLVLWPANQEVPLDYEQARAEIRERFYRSLVRAGFSPENEDLVPLKCDEVTGERVWGGGCGSCPHRSGNALEAEDLAGGALAEGRGSKGGIDPNLCTNLDCWRMKQDAAWAIARAQAEEKGLRVIEGDACKRIFSGDKGKLPNDSKYVDLDEKPREDMAGAAADKLPKWSVLRNESGEKVPVIVARHYITGRTHHLMDKVDAQRVLESTLKAAQEDSKPAEVTTTDAVTPTQTVDPLKEQQRKDKLEKKLKREVLRDCFQELFEQMTTERFDMTDLMLSIELALDAARDACRCIADWLGLKVKGANSWRDYVQPILMHAEAQFETQPALEAFLLICLAAQGTEYRGVEAPAFERMASAFRVSIAEINERVRKAHALAGEGSTDDEDETEPVVAVNETEDPEKTPNLRDWIGEAPKAADPVIVLPTKESAARYADEHLKPEKRKQAPRVADKDSEAKALEAYIETGSIQAAAEAAQVTVNTVKKWHQRRGWRALRDEKIKADKSAAKKGKK